MADETEQRRARRDDQDDAHEMESRNDRNAKLQGFGGEAHFSDPSLGGRQKQHFAVHARRGVDRANRFANRFALRQQNIHLAKLRHDLFRLVLLLGAFNVLRRITFQGQTHTRL